MATGNGVERDLCAAVTWIRAAATRGHAGAQSGLGYLYMVGNGVPRDWTTAIQWWALAAAQGDTDAMIHSGDCYGAPGITSFGLTHNMTTALMWYHQAAIIGELDAQQLLDDGYERGLWDSVTWIRRHHRFLGSVVNRALTSSLLGLQVFFFCLGITYNIIVIFFFYCKRLANDAAVPEFDPEMVEEALEHLHPFQLQHECGKFWDYPADPKAE